MGRCKLGKLWILYYLFYDMLRRAAWLMNLILMIWVWCITGLGHGHEGSLYPHEQEGGLQLASSDKWRIVYHQQRLQSRVSPSRLSLWHLLFYQKIRSGIKFTSKLTFGILLVIFLLTNHRFLHSFIDQSNCTKWNIMNT